MIAAALCRCGLVPLLPLQPRVPARVVLSGVSLAGTVAGAGLAVVVVFWLGVAAGSGWVPSLGRRGVER